MNELRLKCSQMTLSDLDVLKKVINENYESEIKSCTDPADAEGLTKEKKEFNEIVAETLLKKATEIIYN